MFYRTEKCQTLVLSGSIGKAPLPSSGPGLLILPKAQSDCSAAAPGRGVLCVCSSAFAPQLGCRPCSASLSSPCPIPALAAVPVPCRVHLLSLLQPRCTGAGRASLGTVEQHEAFGVGSPSQAVPVAGMPLGKCSHFCWESVIIGLSPGFESGCTEAEG